MHRRRQRFARDPVLNGGPMAVAMKDELAQLDGHGNITVHSPSIGQGYRRLLQLIMTVDDANRHRNARWKSPSNPSAEHEAMKG
jgi:hypothetical protein